MVVDLTQRLASAPFSLVAEKNETTQTFALVLRTYRKEQGWTQSTLAEAWGYSFETISSWERGKRFPAGSEISRLAGLLEMTAKDLARLVSQDRPNARKRGNDGKPFAQGRLLWTLHLGITAQGLQCVLICPLEEGGVWEVPFDPRTDGEAIRLVHRIIHEQVGKQAVGSGEDERQEAWA